jgi:maltose O-acetyltransferase
VSVLIRSLRKLLAKWYYHYVYRPRIRNLVARGLVLGKNVTIAASAYIDGGYPYLIRIGDNCSLASDVRLLAHDATTFKFTDGHTRLGKIEIKDNCFIGEKAIILPGVTIGPNVLVAAGSVVNRDIPPNSCAAGVPARVYARFDDFIGRRKEQLRERDIFEYSDLHLKMDEQLRERVWESVQDGDAYVRGFVGNDLYTLNTD